MDNIFGRRIVQMFKDAFRENLLPGILIQTFALILVGSYYLLPATGELWNALAAFKNNCGISYVFVSTGLFGGVIPGIYMYYLKRFRPGTAVRNVWFLTLFWAYRGFEAEMLYRLQSWMFGDNHAAATVVCKVAVDQFAYNPIWAIPVWAVACAWQQHDFNFHAAVKSLDRVFLTEYMPGMMLSSWIIWIPAVSIVYCMPEVLQLPLSNLILCFFVLVATSLKRR